MAQRLQKAAKARWMREKAQGTRKEAQTAEMRKEVQTAEKTEQAQGGMRKTAKTQETEKLQTPRNNQPSLLDSHEGRFFFFGLVVSFHLFLLERRLCLAGLSELIQVAECRLVLVLVLRLLVLEILELRVESVLVCFAYFFHEFHHRCKDWVVENRALQHVADAVDAVVKLLVGDRLANLFGQRVGLETLDFGHAAQPVYCTRRGFEHVFDFRLLLLAVLLYLLGVELQFIRRELVLRLVIVLGQLKALLGKLLHLVQDVLVHEVVHRVGQVLLDGAHRDVAHAILPVGRVARVGADRVAVARLGRRTARRP